MTRWASIALASLALVACDNSITPSAAPSASALASADQSSSPASAAAPSVQPSPSIVVVPSSSPQPSLDLSSRPFVVLVLGGDDGLRTDAIIVAGIDASHRTLALASIPRDTANVPLPGGGTFTNRKINAFYDFAAGDPATYPQGPGRATADLVEAMLRIHIDYVAVTTFAGFSNLVDAMGGVRISLAKPVVDPYYQVPSGKFGVRFPAGEQTLRGDRALVFVRTRQGDNDFERQRRQQLFLIAAGRQLLSHQSLAAALALASGNLVTDFPLGQVPTLVATMSSIASWDIKQVVLGPTRYESAVACSCGYALQANLAQMRATARAFFPWAVAP